MKTSSKHSVADATKPESSTAVTHPDEPTTEVPIKAGAGVQPAGEPHNAVVESARIGSDGKLTIVCTLRTSQLFMAGAWLHHGGSISEHAREMIECHVECDILDSGLEPGEMFRQPATEKPATAAA